MGTNIRPETSEKNPYWIDRHRYYELKHFCMQYPEWKKAYAELMTPKTRPIDSPTVSRSNTISDPVQACVESRLYFAKRIELIERAARDTDPVIGVYILRGVISGYSYECMKARLDIPCCKDTYYELYRRFFWLLHKARN